MALGEQELGSQELRQGAETAEIRFCKCFWMIINNRKLAGGQFARRHVQDEK